MGEFEAEACEDGGVIGRVADLESWHASVHTQTAQTAQDGRADRAANRERELIEVGREGGVGGGTRGVGAWGGPRCPQQPPAAAQPHH